MNLKIDARAFDRALGQYMALNRKDHVEVLRDKAGDLALRSAQAARGGRVASKPAIQGLWQHTQWDSKTPWQHGRDMWGLFIARLLHNEGFNLNLGRRRVKNQAESSIVHPRSLLPGYRGDAAKGTGRWFDPKTGKYRVGNRATMTEFRHVKIGSMKSSDWRRVSVRILKRRAARVGAFIGAFTRAAAAFGKGRSISRRSWGATIIQPTAQKLIAAFEVPIRGSRYPSRGNKTVSQATDAANKERILNGYLQQGVNFVARDMEVYIARKLSQRANQVGLRAA